jgi:hypothetical protein
VEGAKERGDRREVKGSDQKKREEKRREVDERRAKKRREERIKAAVV